MNIVDGGICLDCGMGHTPQRRRVTIAAMVRNEVPASDIRDGFPCWYPAGDAGARLLYRDIEAVKTAIDASRPPGGQVWSEWRARLDAWVAAVASGFTEGGES